jgi:hypothetical protein
MYLNEIVSKGVDWCFLADRDGNEPSRALKLWEFLIRFSNCLLLNKDSPPFSSLDETVRYCIVENKWLVFGQ